MYSQNEEEKYIVDYFADFRGVFCSIGENDGKTLSNVRRLYELGWSGVCIEPSPQAFPRLKDLYEKVKNVYCYNWAIGTHNGLMQFWDSGHHLNDNDVGLLSTANPEEMKRFPGTEYTPMEVRCYRWRTALNRFKYKDFDFISLDAEGMNAEILEQITLDNVKALVVEWNGNKDLKDKFDSMMKGFRVIYTSPENLLYAR